MEEKSRHQCAEDLIEKILADKQQFRRHLVKEEGVVVEKLFKKYDMTAVASFVRAIIALEKQENPQNEGIQILLDEETEEYGK